jgi:hypothetical protein
MLPRSKIKTFIRKVINPGVKSGANPDFLIDKGILEDYQYLSLNFKES